MEEDTNISNLFLVGGDWLQLVVDYLNKRPHIEVAPIFEAIKFTKLDEATIFKSMETLATDKQRLEVNVADLNRQLKLANESIISAYNVKDIRKDDAKLDDSNGRSATPIAKGARTKRVRQE